MDYGSKISHVKEYEFEGVNRAVVTYWNGTVEGGSIEEFVAMGIYPFNIEPFYVREVLVLLSKKDTKIAELEQQNKQLIEEKEQLQESFQQVNDNYRSLINIMDRARRLAMITAEEEEEERPRFKMDANGNLTSIQGGVSSDN